jgi:hypothetical protein
VPYTLFKPQVLSFPHMERYREPKGFWGARLRQGRALPRSANALILMGDWCGLSNEPDTTETKTRVRKHQKAWGRTDKREGALARALRCCCLFTGGG